MADQANKLPEGFVENELTPGPWYAKKNDLIGGWCVMNVDKPPSQADAREGEWEIASFMRKVDALLVASLVNVHVFRQSRKDDPK